MKVYKVRDIATGLFCRGGYAARFDKKGKTWTQLNHVKCFLNNYARKPHPPTWEIVEYELVERALYNCNTMRPIPIGEDNGWR